MEIFDLIVLGGGPGGYTAALYAARSGLKTLIIEKLAAGGQMALTTQIDNYPGFTDGIDGFQLGEQMQQQAERFGAETILAEVTAVKLKGAEKEVVTTDGTFYGKTVVIDSMLMENKEFAPHYSRMLDIFRDNPLYVIDVSCPLEICRQRNLQRPDRHEFQSHEQAAVMAKDVAYALHLDTSVLTPEQCAQQILTTFFR